MLWWQSFYNIKIYQINLYTLNLRLSLIHNMTMLCVNYISMKLGKKYIVKKVILYCFRIQSCDCTPLVAILIYSRHNRATQNIKIRFESLTIFNNIGILKVLHRKIKKIHILHVKFMSWLFFSNVMAKDHSSLLF